MLSASASLEAGALLEQVHCTDVEDTARFLKMFLSTLDDERVRYRDAMARHDHAAAAESAAEQCALVQMAGVCQDHLRMVGAGRYG